jgi:hypothetical protein
LEPDTEISGGNDMRLIRSLIFVVGLIAAGLAIGHPTARGAPSAADTPQPPTLKMADETCGYTFPLPNASYHKIEIEAATFGDFGRTKFLIFTSNKSKTWVSDAFVIDNLPNDFWVPPPTQFSTHPRYDTYEKKHPENFEIKENQTNPVMSVGVVPIFVTNQTLYCLTGQLKINYPEGYTVWNFGTLATSPVVTTVKVTFRN